MVGITFTSVTFEGWLTVNVVPETIPSPTTKSVGDEPAVTSTPVLPAVHVQPRQGQMPTAKRDKDAMVSVAEADLVESAWLVAVTVTVVLEICGVRLSVPTETIEPPAQELGCEKLQLVPPAATEKEVGAVASGLGRGVGLGAV